MSRPTPEQVARFVADGFLRLDGAFPPEVADAARAVLWRDTGCDPHDVATLEIGRLVADGLAAERAEALATGPAGTVYLCHPFLVHAAQAHRGREPRFLAQPPLLPAEALALERASGRYAPVEAAIRVALGHGEGAGA